MSPDRTTGVPLQKELALHRGVLKYGITTDSLLVVEANKMQQPA